MLSSEAPRRKWAPSASTAISGVNLPSARGTTSSHRASCAAHAANGPSSLLEYANAVSEELTRAILRTVGRRGPLAVVQIPRTGRGAVSRAISSNYTRLETVGEYQHNPRKARATLEELASQSRAQAWVALFCFGLFLRNLPGETRYIRILRDPVSRVFADYSMHVMAGEGPGPPDRKRLRTSWEGALNAARIERDGDDEGPEIMLDDDADLSPRGRSREEDPIDENL